MNQQQIFDKLTEIFRVMFDEYTGPVNEQLTAEAVEQWDSLSHVQLIVMIEQSFGISFTAAELSDLKNVGALARLIESKARKAA
jgi:acyl carrier protein